MLKESSRGVHLHITRPSLFPFPLPLLSRDLYKIVVNTRVWLLLVLSTATTGGDTIVGCRPSLW